MPAVILLLWVVWWALLSGQSALAAGIPCSPCHDRLYSTWGGSPHERSGQSVPKGFRCQECHSGGLLHPSRITPGNAVGRCGRCHWTASASSRGPLSPARTLDRELWVQGKHATAKLTCIACHSVHNYAEGADQHLLIRAGDDLCFSCHPLPKHQDHGVDPAQLAKKPCVSCHNPHGAAASLLDQQSGGNKRDFKLTVTHKPVADGRCSDCHAAHVVPSTRMAADDEEEDPDGLPQTGAVAFKGLLLSPPRVFCYQCHGKFRERFEASGHVHIIQFKQGEERSPCLGCHLPHASDYRRLLKQDGNQLCLSCHPGYAPHHFLARGGVRLSELQCVRCHNPHGTGNRRLLLQEDVCRLCHKV